MNLDIEAPADVSHGGHDTSAEGPQTAAKYKGGRGIKDGTTSKESVPPLGGRRMHL